MPDTSRLLKNATVRLLMFGLAVPNYGILYLRLYVKKWVKKAFALLWNVTMRSLKKKSQRSLQTVSNTEQLITETNTSSLGLETSSSNESSSNTLIPIEEFLNSEQAIANLI